MRTFKIWARDSERSGLFQKSLGLSEKLTITYLNIGRYVGYIKASRTRLFKVDSEGHSAQYTCSKCLIPIEYYVF